MAQASIQSLQRPQRPKASVHALCVRARKPISRNPCKPISRNLPWVHMAPRQCCRPPLQGGCRWACPPPHGTAPGPRSAWIAQSLAGWVAGGGVGGGGGAWCVCVCGGGVWWRRVRGAQYRCAGGTAGHEVPDGRQCHCRRKYQAGGNTNVGESTRQEAVPLLEEVPCRR